MPASVDHLVVTAPTLERGAAWLVEQLGVAPQPGGRHARMGTHNLVLRLGAACYLEVIAVDPSAPPPGRARWFELDRLAADAVPRLAAWVVRSDAIAATLARATEDVGAAEPMDRGTLRWQLSVRADGALPLGGVGPHVIAWSTAPHPAAAMDERGCRLERLVLRHPAPARVEALLRALDVADPAVAIAVEHGDAPALVASIATAHGTRTLGLA